MTTKSLEKSSHCLTSEIASVTWYRGSSESCVRTQGGVEIPRHRRRPVIDVLDPMDVPQAVTLGEFHIANADAKTCQCGCDRLANVMYDGYSKRCHDLLQYQASRVS